MVKEHLPCFPLAVAQSLLLIVLNLLEQRNVETTTTRNNLYKQINKHYTKQYLMTKQIVLKDSTRCYKRVSTGIA
jgi:hypothetical protein